MMLPPDIDTMHDLTKCARKSSRNRSGQTATEYVIVAGMVIASLAILVVFLVSFREYGGRILELMASEYP